MKSLINNGSQPKSNSRPPIGLPTRAQIQHKEHTLLVNINTKQQLVPSATLSDKDITKLKNASELNQIIVHHGEHYKLVSYDTYKAARLRERDKDILLYADGTLVTPIVNQISEHDIDKAINYYKDPSQRFRKSDYYLNGRLVVNKCRFKQNIHRTRMRMKRSQRLQTQRNELIPTEAKPTPQGRTTVVMSRPNLPTPTSLMPTIVAPTPITPFVISSNRSAFFSYRAGHSVCHPPSLTLPSDSTDFMPYQALKAMRRSNTS